jgi:hypothetical protein
VQRRIRSPMQSKAGTCVMSTTSEVRAWAREEGIEVPPRGKLSASVWSAFASAHADADVPATEPAPEPEQIETEQPEAPEPETSPEVQPQPAAPERKGWIKWRPKPAAQSKDKPRRKRVSLEFLSGMAWQGVAAVVANLAGPQYAPVGMMMAFQAPVAGMVIEDVAKETAADRLLQPIARIVQPGGQLATLIGMPMGTALICKYPHLYPRIRPVLAEGMKEWVTLAGPKLRERRRKQEKFSEEMATFQEEFGVTVDQLLDDVFAPLMQPSPAMAAANGSATA